MCTSKGVGHQVVQDAYMKLIDGSRARGGRGKVRSAGFMKTLGNSNIEEDSLEIITARGDG